MMSLALARAALLASLVAALAAPACAQTTACPDPARIKADTRGPQAHIRYLADDALEGREVGTRGADCAADYIAATFRTLGLQPAGAGGTWFQTFPVPRGAALGGENRLRMSGMPTTPGKDWTPLGFSASKELSGSLVYGGHGLSRPGSPDDTLTHVDVAGRIMVVEWGDPDSPTGRGMRADPHFKATVAAGRNAAGLVVLVPEGTPLPAPDHEIRKAMDIPVLAAGGALAAGLREAAKAGQDLTVRTDVRAVTADARNVVAVLPGSDPALRGEYVIVGAHYDHLGMGGEGSLDPDARAVHNGADDNASGTAGILDVARRLAEGPRPARSVLFVAFTGEEKGLWGSARFVAEPTVDLGKAVAMINLDMIGRLTENTVTVYGTGTAQEWEAVANAANATLATPLKLAFSPDGFGPSDQASFVANGIPVLHFFTNTHTDYHRPSDDWEKIDADGLSRISEVVAGISRAVAGTPGAVAVSLTRIRQERPAAPAAGDASRGYGPYFGTIPDMTPRDFGLRITGVREGSPAERAGLKAGDVIVEFDGKPVADIYAYTYALREKKPGDAVKGVVERDGQRFTFNAVLGERPGS
ncbi:MAG: M20/M25/M40 family metallo-hydrolase [Gemmatimonadetes bacterium]|nr:M20/M25/M40 family metallo-hydrolase [Gemmatimonadota bacterium]